MTTFVCGVWIRPPWIDGPHPCGPISTGQPDGGWVIVQNDCTEGGIPVPPWESDAELIDLRDGQGAKEV